MLDDILLSIPHPSNPINAFTTADRKQPIAILGNSTASYATTGGPGTAPTAGTAFEWNGTALGNLGTSLTNSGSAGANKGDWTTNFSTLYYAATAYKPVFTDSHVFGSLLYGSATAQAWITTGFQRGNYYKTWLTKASNLLSFLGLTQFKMIYLGDVLINDVGQSETTADLDTAFRALITFIQQDFPGSPIYGVLMGTNAGQAESQRQATIRMNARVVPASYSGFNYFYFGYYTFSCGNMDATDKHWNQSANEAIGRTLNDYLNDTETDEDAKRSRNMYFDALTSLQKGYVSTYLGSLKAGSNNYAILNALSTHVGTTKNNTAMDFIGLTGPRTDTGGYTFNVKASLETTGSNTYIDARWYPLWMMLHGGQDDCFIGTKVGTNNTAAATAGTLLGVDSASSMSLSQLTTSRLQYKCNDNTGSTYLTDTKFADNTWYFSSRSSSTNKILTKGSTQVATATVTSAARSATLHVLAARNVTPQNVLNLTLTGAFVAGQHSGFDYAAFIAATDTFNANMAL